MDEKKVDFKDKARKIYVNNKKKVEKKKNNFQIPRTVEKVSFKLSLQLCQEHGNALDVRGKDFKADSLAPSTSQLCIIPRPTAPSYIP